MRAKRRPIEGNTGVPFEDAATVFLDPLAITFPDPGHSSQENREITIGTTIKRWFWFLTVSAVVAYASSARGPRPERSESNMKKGSAKTTDKLRRQYDLRELKSGVRGKYYRRAIEG